MQPQFQNSQADSLLKTGIDQIHNCQFSIAVQTLQTALALYLQVKDYAGIVSTLVNLGVAYRNLRQYSEAIASYQQALDLGRKIGAQPFFIASTLNNLGISYNAHGEFQNAIAGW